MDHCRNASEPETAATRSVELPEPEEPAAQLDEAETDPDAAAALDARRALDDWADELRQSHLERTLARLENQDDVDDEQRAVIAACSRRLVDELLRGPHRRVRTNGEFEESLRKLFDLEQE